MSSRPLVFEILHPSDQYRPKKLDELHYHKGLSSRLKSLVGLGLYGISIHYFILLQAASGDFPHMLFYGPSGAGKKTRIACTLRELFGPGVEKVRGMKV